jgi:hypothetical protein
MDKLSLRARGLYLLYRSMGEVLPASEVSQLVPEGRDAIRKAMSELKEHGYIEEIRYQTAYGHWHVLLRFTGAWKTEDGFSGHLCHCTECIANSDRTLVLFSNENNTRVSGTPKENEMGWPGFDESSTKDDEVVGAVGKLPEDKKAIRQQKYTKTKIEASRSSSTRSERPEDTWTTDDLLAEFYDLTRQHAPGVPSQVNGKSLASWLNQRVGQGTPRVALLKAIRLFFNDPRVVRDPGVGQPLWRRFIAFYPTVHGIVTRVDNDYQDDDTSSHEEKMLRLLEG